MTSDQDIRTALRHANPVRQSSGEIVALREHVWSRVETEIRHDTHPGGDLSRTRRHRTPARALLVLAVATGAVVATALSFRASHISIADRALAAIGNGPVVHVISRWQTDSSSVDLSTGATHPVWEETEEWFDAGQARSHLIDRRDGKVVDDILVQQNGPSTSSLGPVRVKPGEAPAIDPAIGNVIDDYRRVLAAGEARVIGDGTVNGTAVYWLEFRDGHGRNNQERVAVDKATFKPLLVQAKSGRKYDIETIETVSRGVANFTPPHLLPASERPSRGEVVKTDTVPAGDVAARFSSSALWLGNSFDGKPLVRADVENLRTSYPDPGLSPTLRNGLALYYSNGSERHPLEGHYLLLQQAPQPEMAYRWGGISAPAAGSMLLVPHLGAFLVTHGEYITLTTNEPDAAATLLHAAQALTSGCCTSGP